VNPLKDGIRIPPRAVQILTGVVALGVALAIAEELPQMVRYLKAERMGLMPQQKRNKAAIRP
jgi:hydrogenase/urease accessory protein HupE